MSNKSLNDDEYNLKIKNETFENVKISKNESINRLMTNDTFLISENAIIILDFDNIHENTVLDISGRGNDAKFVPPIDIVYN